MENEVAELWKVIVPHVVRDLVPGSDFFDIGGNSILLVKLQSTIKRDVQSAPIMVDLINASSLEGMARHVRTAYSQEINWWSGDRGCRVAGWTLRGKKTTLFEGQQKSHGLHSRRHWPFGRHILAHHIDTASASVTRITCPVRPSHLSRPHPYIRSLKSILSLQTYLNYPSTSMCQRSPL
jgi:hybrid polyketide synthase/nonribosomal peptide synthetase ACE1